MSILAVSAKGIMKLAVMQPYLFPYLGYYQLYAAADRFVFFDDVNFINKGWINRNQIVTGRKAFMFTAPLLDASQNKLICDIHIAEGNWKQKLLKTIEMAYKKAPEFVPVFELVSGILATDTTLIAKLAAASVTGVAAYLNIQKPVYFSSELQYNRDVKGEDKILEICTGMGAVNYINPSGGRDLYNPEKFEKSNLGLHFLKPQLPNYRQFTETFVPAMSVIDVLMHNPAEQVANWMNTYTLEP